MSWRRPLIFLCLPAFILFTHSARAESPKNVIFMIGDGMGFEHVKAAGMYLNGTPGTLCFESLPYQGQVTTYSASSSITDSAAAATAMATGHKVNNGVVSMAYPGDGSEYQTLLETYKARGARTGLVTTTVMTHATPACFGAHEPNRYNYSSIAGDYLNQTKPNTLLGGGANGLTLSDATAAGYTVVTNNASMQAIDTNTVSMLSGQFGTTHLPYEYDGLGTLPHLSEMTTTALDILDNDPDGFFLMIESGRIDHAASANDIARDVFETVEFHNTAQLMINWAVGRTDTLIIVTADHETGGLTVLQNNGKDHFPTVSWSTSGHTSTNVPVYAWGVNAQYVTGTLDNTQLFKVVNDPTPKIVLSQTTFTKSVQRGQNLPPDTDSFTVTNGGLGTMAYDISSDVTWVGTDPTAGSSSGEADTIWLVYNTASLTPGNYAGHLEVASGSASNSPQTVTVNLTVKSGPGDFDLDDDVDQEDFGRFQACLTGPTAPITDPNCQDADLNQSTHVDSADLTLFRKCLSGPGILANPNCLNLP